MDLGHLKGLLTQAANEADAGALKALLAEAVEMIDAEIAERGIRLSWQEEEIVAVVRHFDMRPGQARAVQQIYMGTNGRLTGDQFKQAAEALDARGFLNLSGKNSMEVTDKGYEFIRRT